MTDDQKRRDAGVPFREGVRAITGIVGALRDAIEETFDDLRQQGELSPEKAKEAARSTMRRAQEAVDDVRDRLDFVPRRDFDALRDEVAELRRRVDELSGAATAPSGSAAPPPPGDPGGAGGPEQGPGFPVDGA